MKKLFLKDLKNVIGGKKVIFDIIQNNLGSCTISRRFYKDNNIYWFFVPGIFESIADAQSAVRAIINNRNQEYEGAEVIVNIRHKF